MERRLDKIIYFSYLTLVIATPLLMFHKTSELFEFNKMLFIYLITLIISVSWLLQTLLKGESTLSRSKTSIALVVFFASQILSLIFSIDKHTSFFGYYSRFNGGVLSLFCYLILFFIAHDTFRLSLYRVEKMLRFSLISSFLVILWGLPGRLGYDLSCLVFTGKLYNGCWTDQFHPALRMFSTLGQPNWLGAYLAINFFIGAYFLIKKQSNKIWYRPIFLYLALNFSAILFTRSRSALFAVFVSLIILIYSNYKNKILKKQTIFYLGATLFVLILFFKTGIGKIDKIITLNFVSKTPTSISNSIQPAQPLNITESFDIRRIVWKGAIELGLKYPLFGTGVETFAYSYNFVRPKEHNLTSEWDFIYNKAHNEYLNYFATTGFVGLGAYLLFIVMVVKHFLRFVFSSSSEPEYRLLASAILSAWITILITNFFGFSTTMVNLYFFVLPAIFLAISKDVKPIHIRFPIAKNLKTNKILPGVALFIFVLGAFYIFRYFVADVTYAAGDNSFKSQDFDQSEKKIKNALSLRYESVYADKLSTVLANKLVYYALGQSANDKKIAEIIAESDKYNLLALNSSRQNGNYWKTRAKNYYVFYQLTSQQNFFDEALIALDTAKKLAPTDAKLYYTEAIMLLSEYDSTKPSTSDVKVVSLENILVLAQKSIELKSNYRDGYFISGQVMEKMGKAQEARKNYQYIIDNINREDAEVLEKLSSL